MAFLRTDENNVLFGVLSECNGLQHFQHMICLVVGSGRRDDI